MGSNVGYLTRSGPKARRINACINPSLIIYDFLEVPWGLGRLPWGPGAAPWGGVPTQCLRVRNRKALLVLASFFMSILMSIFDRLGVDLGSVLGVIFGRFGALVGQSWSQSRLRNVLTSKK